MAVFRRRSSTRAAAVTWLPSVAGYRLQVRSCRRGRQNSSCCGGRAGVAHPDDVARCRRAHGRPEQRRTPRCPRTARRSGRAAHPRGVLDRANPYRIAVAVPRRSFAAELRAERAPPDRTEPQPVKDPVTAGTRRGGRAGSARPGRPRRGREQPTAPRQRVPLRWPRSGKGRAGGCRRRRPGCSTARGGCRRRCWERWAVDWRGWHAAYDDPGSALSRRLALVQAEIRSAGRPAAGRLGGGR